MERMTLVRTSDWLMDALRVVGEFEIRILFTMQRNEKPARPHPFQSKYVLYSQEEQLIVSYSKS